ncbi:MAG: polysaccharide biosynthesis C-terminal domain-containing protein [Bacteroidota bacterium]
MAILISRYLHASGKGAQSIILTTISFILIFANIAGGATLVYLTPRFKVSILVITSYLWSIVIGVFSYFILKISAIVPDGFIIHICVLSVINSFGAINANILLGREKIISSNIVNFVQPVITVIILLIFILVFNINDVIIYIYALYFAYAISFIISIILIRTDLIDFFKIKFNEFKEVLKSMFNYGFYNQLGHVTQFLNFRISYYLLNSYHGEKSLGIYSNGVSLTEAIWLVSGSMAMVQYSKIVNTNDWKYAQQLTINLTKISILITLIAIIPMILLPSEFYAFIYSKEFGSINHIMLCLAPGVLVYNLALLTMHYFSGTGRYYINTLASFYGLIVTALLGFWAIPKYGIYGAALVSSCSYIITSVVAFYYFRKDSGINIFELLPNLKDISYYIKTIKELFINKTKNVEKNQQGF